MTRCLLKCANTESDSIHRYEQLGINPSRPEASPERDVRNPLLGPDRGAFDLATNYRNGRITRQAALHFLSDVTIDFVSRQGESFGSGTVLANAILAFVEVIAPNPILVQDCRHRVGR